MKSIVTINLGQALCSLRAFFRLLTKMVGSVMPAYEPKLTTSPLKDVNGHSSHFNLDGIAVQAVLTKISPL